MLQDLNDNMYRYIIYFYILYTYLLHWPVRRKLLISCEPRNTRLRFLESAKDRCFNNNDPMQWATAFSSPRNANRYATYYY